MVDVGGIDLLEDISRCLVGAVEDDIELLPLLHLFQQRAGVFTSCWQLADLDFNAVSGRSFDQLLQTDQPFDEKRRPLLDSTTTCLKQSHPLKVF